MEPITIVIPAFNCENSIVQSIESVIASNYSKYDEIIVCDDFSCDLTPHILDTLKQKYPFLKIIRHLSNQGGASARNTCCEASSNNLIFCLDSDNMLYPGSINYLRSLWSFRPTDLLAFSSMHYYRLADNESFPDINSINLNDVTHSWDFSPGSQTLDDYLFGTMVAGFHGNYLFTKSSWERVGGYIPGSGALDTWSFGLKQAAFNCSCQIAPLGAYIHTYGLDSYWIRDQSKYRDNIATIISHLNALDLPKDVIHRIKSSINDKVPFKFDSIPKLKGYWGTQSIRYQSRRTIVNNYLMKTMQVIKSVK